LSSEFIDRGKVIQIETFDAPSSFWTCTPTDAVSITDQGALVSRSVILQQTAKTTFGFIRLLIDATLVDSDTTSLVLVTSEESIELRKTKDTVGLYINGNVLEEVDYDSSQVTLQFVLNDERVGCFAIGHRIHTLASRYKVASFDQQPYQFELKTRINHSSHVILKEVVYESVSE
jgi:hypothetical protein